MLKVLKHLHLFKNLLLYLKKYVQLKKFYLRRHPTCADDIPHKDALPTCVVFALLTNYEFIKYRNLKYH